MRVFAKFLALIAIAALLAGLLTYPAWWLIQNVADVPIHRVMHRVGMLILAGALFYFLRRWGLATKSALGYSKSRPQFLIEMSVGFAAGIALMLPFAFALFGLSIRSLNADASAIVLSKWILQGLLTGWSVAFIEETFFRGAMFGAVQRESGILGAIVLPTIVYAAAHFIAGDLRIPSDQVTYASGLQVVGNMFAQFTSPLILLDSFIALCALGVLLSLIRIRTGVIAGGIGLHAAGVCVITVMRNCTHVNGSAPLVSLVGNYDGVIGWLMTAWISLVAIVYWQLSGTRRPKN